MPPPPAPVPLWTLPKSERPPHGSLLHGLCWAVVFNSAILLTNLLQLLSYPLSLFPFTRPLYAAVIRFTKGSFGQLTVLISQWFAPTSFVVSGGEGMGEQLEWVERDERASVVGVRLAEQGVWMANHQTLSDWLYLWSFAYLSRHHDSLYITLKRSLKWIPFVGWACQLFGFVFLSRNWVADKAPLKSQLDKVAEGVEGRKMALLFFPEGTLVTGNTRPLSAAYALKTGVADFKHTLLPRSTGLFFALRTLRPHLPTLSLIDLTLGYPGPIAPYWPEDYYDLTLWFKAVPPPAIHVHVRQYPLFLIPLGDSEGEGTEAERAAFDEWLRERWGEKDELLDRFVQTGSFDERDNTGAQKEAAVRFPLALRRWYEVGGAFSYGAGLVMLYVGGPIVLGLLWRVWGQEGVSEAAKSAGCGCAKMAAAANAARGEL